METVESPQAWNALPINTYAVVTSLVPGRQMILCDPTLSPGRTETVFVTRCAEDRAVMCGDHLIAGGKHWTDLFPGAESATVLYRPEDGGEGAEQTRVAHLTFARAAAEYLDESDLYLMVKASLREGKPLSDSAALWLALDLSATGDFPALSSLHSTGSAPTAELRRDLEALKDRDRNRKAADLADVMLLWLAARWP